MFNFFVSHRNAEVKSPRTKMKEYRARMSAEKRAEARAKNNANLDYAWCDLAHSGEPLVGLFRPYRQEEQAWLLHPVEVFHIVHTERFFSQNGPNLVSTRGEGLLNERRRTPEPREIRRTRSPPSPPPLPHRRRTAPPKPKPRNRKPAFWWWTKR